MSEQDTREKLESDIHKWTTCSWVTVSHEKVIDWLDRQVAITRRETYQSWQAECDRLEEMRERYTRQLNEISTAFGVEITDDIQTHTNTMKAIKELTAERDKLKAELREYERIDKEAIEACIGCNLVDELTAERDKLQAAIDAMGNGQFYSMYKAKCEECERLKKVVRTQAESFKKLECELAGKQ